MAATKTLSYFDLAVENADLKRQMAKMQEQNLKKAAEYQNALTLAAETVKLRELVKVLRKEIGEAIEMIDKIN